MALKACYPLFYHPHLFTVYPQAQETRAQKDKSRIRPEYLNVNTKSQTDSSEEWAMRGSQSKVKPQTILTKIHLNLNRIHKEIKTG